MAEFTVSQPAWMEEFLSSRGTTYETIDERMKLVLDATRLNVEHATGGPFGAAVFEKKSGRLLSVSVNSVVRHGWSGAHAEAMAIIFASKAHGGYDLGGNLTTEHQLVVNAQPCVMCLGSVIWSGVTEVNASLCTKSTIQCGMFVVWAASKFARLQRLSGEQRAVRWRRSQALTRGRCRKIT